MTTFRRPQRIRLLFALLLCLPAGSGCSVATGNMLTFFPQRQNLDEDADAIRKSLGTQGVLPLPRELSKAVTPLYVIEPGDVILVQPAELDTTLVFPPDQTVLPDGTVHLGKYGQVNVA